MLHDPEKGRLSDKIMRDMRTRPMEPRPSALAGRTSAQAGVLFHQRVLGGQRFGQR